MVMVKVRQRIHADPFCPWYPLPTSHRGSQQESTSEIVGIFFIEICLSPGDIEI
jgi:hypothetical protein